MVPAKAVVGIKKEKKKKSNETVKLSGRLICVNLVFMVNRLCLFV